MKDIRVTLLYPPHQSWPGSMCKPNGSLAYPSLAGALREIGVDVEIFDACVGGEQDDLDQVFYNAAELESGLFRTGVSEDRILGQIADSDIVGLTSIFSDQETMVLACARLIKQAAPEKLLVAGGVNARSRKEHFFTAGFDIVCLSESEKTIQRIARKVQEGSVDYADVPGIAYRKAGKTVVQPTSTEDVVWDLDDLPMPAWELLPHDRYWRIGRPHGGHFESTDEMAYASMMTSLGCPFACQYCHIAGETEDGESGPIGRFRIKSDERVFAELDALQALGVKQVFLEDDSLFGRKRRMMKILDGIKGAGFDILDVNGVNLVHLLNKNEVDIDLLDALVEAGFKELSLPFESGNARIVKKYANNKWDVDRAPVVDLIRAYRDRGITIAGNYMIGFPDETRAEIEETIAMARRHVEAGLHSANFFLVLPLPGTPLFDMAVREGFLPEDFNIDRMHWLKANMVNTAVPPDELETIRSEAWRELNDTSYVDYKLSMNAQG